ncbi:MAG: HAMP domain-containing protein [Candidatus Moraniibacteriota bacterium]|nr:MAG: HAMP domain-containing protein [Candidatus Moranbacteria bacterium]
MNIRSQLFASYLALVLLGAGTWLFLIVEVKTLARTHEEYERMELNSFSDTTLSKHVGESQIFDESLKRVLDIVAVSVVTWSILSVVVIWRVSSRFTKPILELKLGMQRVSQGESSVRTTISSRDEFGELSEAFNRMAEELEGDRENIEKKVASRTAELERMNRIMMDRESKMIELKEKIRELEQHYGNIRGND